MYSAFEVSYKNALYKSTVITVIIIITVVHILYVSVTEVAP